MENKKNISVITLAMLMFMAVFGITNIANNYANFGNSAIGWFILVGLYFIPLALIMSEMATHKSCEDNNSGLASWITLGLGETWGFIGAWCFFVANIFYLPTLASRVPVFLSWVFTAQFETLDEVVASGAQVEGVMSATSNPTLFLGAAFVVVIISIIAAIYIENIFEFLGRYIGYVSLFITFLFIVLSLLAAPLLADVTIANPITFDNAEVTGIVPSFSAASLSTFAWVLFAIAGIETVGNYVGRINNPEKKVPKGILLAAATVIVAYILGFIGMSFILTPDQVPITSLENLLPIMYAQVGALWGFGPWFLKVTMLIFAVITMTALVLWLTATVNFLFDRLPQGMLPDKLANHRVNGISTFGLAFTSVMIYLVLILSNSSSGENVYSTLYSMSTIAVVLPYLLVGIAYIAFKLRGESGDYVVTNNKTIAVILGVFVSIVSAIAVFFSTWDLSIEDMSERIEWLKLSGGGLLFFILVGVTFYMRKESELYMILSLIATLVVGFFIF